jgi:hypothetical protein
MVSSKQCVPETSFPFGCVSRLVRTSLSVLFTISLSLAIFGCTGASRIGTSQIAQESAAKRGATQAVAVASSLGTRPSNKDKDLGLTPDELRARIITISKKYKQTAHPSHIQHHTDPDYLFSLNEQFAVSGDLNPKTKRSRNVICHADAYSMDDAAEALVNFALVIQAVDPQLTQEARNGILHELGILDSDADPEHLAGNCIQNGFRYQSVTMPDNTLALQISRPNDAVVSSTDAR